MINGLLALIVALGVMQAGAVETIAKDSMSNVEEAGTRVAFTPAEWASLWQAHAGDEPRPDVDFATRRVVAIFLGTRPTPGYDIEIIGTKHEGNTLIVEWAEVRPRQGLLQAQVLTSPAVIASVPKVGDQVGFRKVAR